MKIVKKSWLICGLACLCALTLVLAGCGSSSSSAASDSSATASEPEEVPVEAEAESTDEAATTEAEGSGWYASKEADANGYKLVEEGTIIGVSDMAYPPLESVVEGKSDEYEGFEIDVMGEVTNRLGLKMKWLNPMKFDAIIPLIKQGGKADVGVSSFTITDERKKEIDFSDSYIDSNQAIVMKEGSKLKGADDNATIENLNADGIVVCVQQGTTGEDWVKENLPKAQCLPLDNAIDCLHNLEAGKCDAAVADLPCMSFYCKESFKDFEVAVAIPTGEQYGIVVSKENAKLTEDINKALDEMKSDGTLDKLMEKWFGGNI
ncbi:MAG: amino acid ABC transporter substrate-binding protein [Atopobiaceae bacterium]|nr:amino acid ABC transporter substrate-binding protein [Atopobiaceae bacterium]